MTTRKTTLFNWSLLQKGKWRDRKFYIEKDSGIEASRKTITHEYPNTITRYVEDLGNRRKIYPIEALIETTRSFTQRDGLIKDLDREGIGTLQHPFYGKKQCVVKGYSLVNEFGVARFTITFEEADNNVRGIRFSNTKSLLNKIKSKIKSLQETSFGQTLNAIKNGYQSFIAVKESIENFVDEILEVINTATNIINQVVDLQNDIADFLKNINTIIKAPSELATRISTIFSKFENTGSDAKSQFTQAMSIFNFDDGFKKSIHTSSTSIQNDENNLAINNIFKVNALTIAYNNAISIEYTNEQELKDTIEILENAFISLDSLDIDTEFDLDNLRATANIIFNRLTLTVPKVFTIEVNSPQNIYQIVYNYYGEFSTTEDYEEKVQQIIDLNFITNPNFIRGNIKLISN